MNIGQRIREVREDLGMQAAVLARRVGVAPNTIYRIEAGDRTPSVALLQKIARELRTEPADFFKKPVPLAEAPETGQQLAPEAMPGPSGHAHQVGFHETDKGTKVTYTKKSFFEIMRDTKLFELRREVEAGRLSEEDAWERYQEEAG